MRVTLLVISMGTAIMPSSAIGQQMQSTWRVRGSLDVHPKNDHRLVPLAEKSMVQGLWAWDSGWEIVEFLIQRGLGVQRFRFFWGVPEYSYSRINPKTPF